MLSAFDAISRLRIVVITALSLVIGCPGFQVGGTDAGPGELDDSGASDAFRDSMSSDSGPDALADGAPGDIPRLDAGACILGELCDDGDACTEGELCLESGCGGGNAIVCEGTNLRCEDDTLIGETFTGACEASTGCVAEENVTMCSFSCVSGGCTSCQTTEWTQASLPFVIRGSAAEITKFAVDESGGQHVLFPTERMGEKFLEVAVDYAYRAGDGASWTITPIVAPGRFISDLSLALHGSEAHFLVLAQESLFYWRPDGATWIEEAVPGRSYQGWSALVMRPDGQPHVVRSGLSNLMHAQRSSGVWTETRVPDAARTSGLSALVFDGDIRVVFRGDDGLGFARYDGSTWTIRREEISGIVLKPKLAIAPDGTLVTSFEFGDGDIAVGTISSAGDWSSLVLTAGIPRVNDQHSIAIDVAGGTHVVFQGIQERRTHYAYRRPGGSGFTFTEIVLGTELGFNLRVDEIGKLRMVSEHVLPVVGSELRFSTRQTCP